VADLLAQGWSDVPFSHLTTAQAPVILIIRSIAVTSPHTLSATYKPAPPVASYTMILGRSRTIISANASVGIIMTWILDRIASNLGRKPSGPQDKQIDTLRKLLPRLSYVPLPNSILHTPAHLLYLHSATARHHLLPPSINWTLHSLA
jgi:hypothetical protein